MWEGKISGVVNPADVLQTDTNNISRIGGIGSGPIVENFMLQETGDFLLLEDYHFIILE